LRECCSLLPATLVIGFCLAIAAMQPASAQSSATVRLVGVIPPQASVQFGVNSPGVVTLNLDNPQGTIPLFNLLDSNNGGEGYTISIVSTNNTAQGVPELVARDGTAAPVPFQLTYNGQPLQFQNGSATLKTTGGENTGDKSGALGLVPLGQGGTNGSYTDTLQFVIRGH
jgi:hypothetical protein